MSDFLKAADDARRLLRGFKAFEEVAAALEMAGIAQQTKAEAESKLAFLLTKIETAKVEAEEQAGKNAAAIAAAQAQADEIVRDAWNRAKKIAEDAKAEAAETAAIVSREKLAAEERLAADVAAAAAAQIQRDELAAEVKDLEARVEKARKYLAKLAD